MSELKLEVGKSYITFGGFIVKVVYISNLTLQYRFLFIREDLGQAVWYNITGRSPLGRDYGLKAEYNPEEEKRKEYAKWLKGLKMDDPVTVRLSCTSPPWRRHIETLLITGNPCAVCWDCGKTSHTTNNKRLVTGWPEIKHPDGTWLRVADYADLLKE